MIPDSKSPLHTGNRFNRMEWAGAFGDLGTLIPFMVAYIAVVKGDPFGILFTFGKRRYCFFIWEGRAPAYATRCVERHEYAVRNGIA